MGAATSAEPNSAKNREGERHREMPRTTKGKQRLFGIKVQIEVVAELGPVQAVSGTRGQRQRSDAGWRRAAGQNVLRHTTVATNTAS